MRIISKTSKEKKVIDETKKHIAQVGENIDKVINVLKQKAKDHDKSKLEKEEFPGFLEYTDKLEHSTYGSDEYKEFLKGLKPTLDHHYSVNSHHPEYHKDGIDGMTLIDLVEMYCDWLAATKRHRDGDISKSIEINQKRFKMNDQLVNIFKNTANEIK